MKKLDNTIKMLPILAMEEMKGKLANKYYMLAEEAWAHVEYIIIIIVFISHKNSEIIFICTLAPSFIYKTYVFNNMLITSRLGHVVYS